VKTVARNGKRYQQTSITLFFQKMQAVAQKEIPQHEALAQASALVLKFYQNT
jgi:hypothetical protein